MTSLNLFSQIQLLSIVAVIDLRNAGLFAYECYLTQRVTSHVSSTESTDKHDHLN